MDFSPIPGVYSEDSGQETSDSSDDEMHLIDGDLVKLRKDRSSSPQENEFLAGLMKSPGKPQSDSKAKQALDK